MVSISIIGADEAEETRILRHLPDATLQPWPPPDVRGPEPALPAALPDLVVLYFRSNEALVAWSSLRDPAAEAAVPLLVLTAAEHLNTAEQARRRAPAATRVLLDDADGDAIASAATALLLGTAGAPPALEAPDEPPAPLTDEGLAEAMGPLAESVLDVDLETEEIDADDIDPDVFGADVVDAEVAAPPGPPPLPPHGAAPSPTPAPETLTAPLLSPDAYVRLLSRALVMWEVECARTLAQRDLARDAFRKLRDKAFALDAEREKAQEQLQRVSQDVVRLKKAVTTLRARAAPNRPDDGAESDPPAADATGNGAGGPAASAEPAPATDRVREALARLAETERRLTEVERELAESREAAEQAWGECDVLTVRVGEAEDALAAEKRQHAAAADALRESRAVAARQAALHDELGREVVRLRAERDDIEAQIGAAADRVAELEAVLAERRDAEDALRRDMEERSAALGLVKTALAAAQSERDAAAERATAALAELAALEDELDAAQQESAALAARVRELHDETEQRGDALAKAEARSARLKAALDVARAEADAARQQGDAPPPRLRELERVVAERDERIRALEAEAAAAARAAERAHDRPLPPLEAVEPVVPRPGGPVDSDPALRARLRELEAERNRLATENRVRADRERTLALQLASAEAAVDDLERALAKQKKAPVASGGPAAPFNNEEREAQLARIRLLEMELELTRAQGPPSRAESGRDATGRGAAAGGPAQDVCRHIAELTAAHLSELQAQRTRLGDGERRFQELRRTIGQEVGRFLQFVTASPAARFGESPEGVLQAMQQLVDEGAASIANGRDLIVNQESVLQTIRQLVEGGA